jgi:kojibiose phosphorylase
VAGIFDKSEAQVKELVNLPYFWGLKIYLKYEYLNPFECEILDYKRILDMKQGLLYKKMRLRDKKNRITKIEGYRFLSHDNRNLALMKYKITPENYKDRMTLEYFIDGKTANSVSHPKERVKHYFLTNHIVSDDYLYLEACTRDINHKVGILSSVEIENYHSKITRNYIDFIAQSIDIDPIPQNEYTINIYTSILDSRRYDNLYENNIKEIKKARNIGIEKLLENHNKKFKKL